MRKFRYRYMVPQAEVLHLLIFMDPLHLACRHVLSILLCAGPMLECRMGRRVVPIYETQLGFGTVSPGRGAVLIKINMPLAAYSILFCAGKHVVIQLDTFVYTPHRSLRCWKFNLSPTCCVTLVKASFLSRCLHGFFPFYTLFST